MNIQGINPTMSKFCACNIRRMLCTQVEFSVLNSQHNSNVINCLSEMRTATETKIRPCIAPGTSQTPRLWRQPEATSRGGCTARYLAATGRCHRCNEPRQQRLAGCQGAAAFGEQRPALGRCLCQPDNRRGGYLTGWQVGAEKERAKIVEQLSIPSPSRWQEETV